MLVVLPVKMTSLGVTIGKADQQVMTFKGNSLFLPLPLSLMVCRAAEKLVLQRQGGPRVLAGGVEGGSGLEARGRATVWGGQLLVIHSRDFSGKMTGVAVRWPYDSHSVTSNPAVLSQGTPCPRLRGGKTWVCHRPLIHGGESILWSWWPSPQQERSKELAMAEPPRRFWEPVHTQRRFETFPAFSVSFFKHGAILGFQSCLLNKHVAQKPPDMFSSGSPSTNWKWGGGRDLVEEESCIWATSKRHWEKSTVRTQLNRTSRCCPKVVCGAWNKIQLPSPNACFLHPAWSERSFCIVTDFHLWQAHRCFYVECIYCSTLIAKDMKGSFFLISYKIKSFFMILV